MSNKRGKRAQVEISFGWLFAIIVGAIILFFAIYASVKLIHTEESVSTAETGKQITVLLNPLETGFGEEKTTPLTLAIESQINNGCNNFGEFGEQEISVAQKTSGKWSDTGISQIFYNKYVFSNSTVQGKNFYLFSKPFEFPFNVADLVYLTSADDKYCFIGASEDIQKELKNLNQPNLFAGNCPSQSTRVCFGNVDENNCNIRVDTNNKSVEYSETNERTYYETDALMFAAIFSGQDKELYECQVKRLMQRTESLALVYNDKESALVGKGCSTEIGLLELANAAASVQDSSELVSLDSAVADADYSNKRAYCGLW